MSKNPRNDFLGGKKSACGSQEDLTKLILDSGKWLDKVDETFSRQLQHVSKAFHPLYLAVHLPIQHHGGGLRRRPPTVVEAAKGRLHNVGWEDEWLDQVDETFLKHCGIVAKMLDPFCPAIYRCLKQ